MKKALPSLTVANLVLGLAQLERKREETRIVLDAVMRPLMDVNLEDAFKDQPMGADRTVWVTHEVDGKALRWSLELRERRVCCWWTDSLFAGHQSVFSIAVWHPKERVVIPGELVTSVHAALQAFLDNLSRRVPLVTASVRHVLEEA